MGAWGARSTAAPLLELFNPRRRSSSAIRAFRAAISAACTLTSAIGSPRGLGRQPRSLATGPAPKSLLHAREPVFDDDGKLAALAVLIAHAITGLQRNPGARLRRTLGAALRNPHAVEHGVEIGAVGLDFEG